MNESDLEEVTLTTDQENSLDQETQKEAKNDISAQIGKSYQNSQTLPQSAVMKEVDPDDVSIDVGCSCCAMKKGCKEKKKREKGKCCQSCLNFYCGDRMHYMTCVLCWGVLPGSIWFIICAIISGCVWGIMGGQTVLIVGIVFLCLSIVGFCSCINLAALYSHCYPTDNIGSQGCCPWCSD